MTSPIALSHYQLRPLLQQHPAVSSQIELSLDLGLSLTEVLIRPDGVELPAGQLLTWQTAETIVAAENNCFVLERGELHKAMVYSDHTDRLYSLMPTPAAPTMLVSGIPMHRIKGTDPVRDTRSKIKTIAPVVGPALDTATGLGYTAIEAARSADQVTTIELDPAVLSLAQLNPWSRSLFDRPNIARRIGDSAEVITEFADASLSRIIHDPPAFGLAGELYGAEFYRQLYRVLRRGGRLYHYVGNPASRSGRNVTQGVLERLRAAGFARVARRPEAFGVVASK